MVTRTGRWKPTSEQAAHLLSFSQNGEHYIKHFSQMKSQYAGEFIAILDSNVILSNMDARTLLGMLREQYPETAFSKIYITYIPTEEEVRIA